MKLSIEATDKLENKDFHYELTISKTHIAMVEEKIKKLEAWSL